MQQLIFAAGTLFYIRNYYVARTLYSNKNDDFGEIAEELIAHSLSRRLPRSRTNVFGSEVHFETTRRAILARGHRVPAPCTKSARERQDRSEYNAFLEARAPACDLREAQSLVSSVAYCKTEPDEAQLRDIRIISRAKTK